MKKIAINYAYDGFLYAPLFLANDLGLFPQNMEVVCRHDDVLTVEALTRKNGKYHNWFAICDPFAKEIGALQGAVGGNDPVCIAGAFINHLPVWLYNTNPEIDPVPNEESLKRHRSCIEEIRCYKRYNTGYLIGERLRGDEIFGLAKSKLHEFAFGDEFNQPYNGNTLIVTSDVLRIAKEADAKNIVFSYPQRCDELNPFLFTGILTLKSVIDKHLYSVLAVLSGLRTAIEILSNESIPDEVTNHLITRFSAELGTFTYNEKKEKVLDAIYILREEKIYSKDFDVNDAERAYNKAKTAWENLSKSHSLNKTFQPIEKVNDPIPALLIKENWKEDRALVDLFTKNLGLSSDSQNQVKSTSESFIRDSLFAKIPSFILAFLIFLYSMDKTINHLPSHFSLKGDEADSSYFLCAFIILTGSLILMFLAMITRKIWFLDNKNTFWSCFVLIGLLQSYQISLNPRDSNPPKQSVNNVSVSNTNSNEANH